MNEYHEVVARKLMREIDMENTPSVDDMDYVIEVLRKELLVTDNNPEADPYYARAITRVIDLLNARTEYIQDVLLHDIPEHAHIRAETLGRRQEKSIHYYASQLNNLVRQANEHLCLLYTSPSPRDS